MLMGGRLEWWLPSSQLLKQEELNGIDVLAKHSAAALASLAEATLALPVVDWYNWLPLSGGVCRP
jgi:hypothetical protein